MRTFAITDVGMVRQVNQDYVFATDRPLGILQNLFVCGGRNGADIRQAIMRQNIRVEVLQRELKMSEGEDVGEVPCGCDQDSQPGDHQRSVRE